ncbi:hypothetical protein [Ancylobacter oerskovii]|uniref:Uncharacterized protein n=1 Tax=Ancylobacter oerskovii TaxID=459519 RepID=A0ABW4YRZ0_9HYPH|nr:hypothetical protein [Ancylobacter oerskovii]MBS7545454.1 hypothetical protein [Ancylobacter oerskovii]
MSKLPAPKLVRHALALPALAVVLAAGAVLPAQAQVYYRPYAPPPGYVPAPRYAPPPGYPPPIYRPPVVRPYSPPVMPRADMRPMLSSMGLRNISRPRTEGQFYVSEATDAMGRRVQVRVSAYSGTVVSMRPIGPAVSGSPAGERAPMPLTNVLPPKKPPLPGSPHAPLSASLPEAGASTPAGEQRPVDPAPSAMAPSPMAPAAGGAAPVAPQPSVAAVSPAAPAGTSGEARPAETPGGTPVRVIPGVATPSNATRPESGPPAAATPAASTPSVAAPAASAPAAEPPGRAPNVLEARAGVSTGAGAGAAEVPAGTASVLVREVDEPPKPTPKPPVN